MKIKFLATAQSPDTYSFSGDIITATHKGQSEDFDLSLIEEGDEFGTEDAHGCEPETLNLNGRQVIRDAKRVAAELEVILCQAPPVTKVSYRTESGIVTLPPDEDPPEYTEKIEHRGGDWKGSAWIDASNYDPDQQYIKEVENG